MHSLADCDQRAPAPTLVERVQRLEEAVLQVPQVDLSTAHAVCGRLYARTIRIPAGTVLTGATHRKDHIDVFQGDISVTTDDGVKRFTGQHVLSVKAGHKRAGWAHADTVWTTVVQTELTNIEAIENEVVEEAEKLQTRTLGLVLEPLKVEG